MTSKYEEYFSNWLNSNMPKVSEWYFISNIDYLLFNHRSKKFILIELKTQANNLTVWQKNMYNMLHKRFIATNWTDWYNYIWTYLITFNWANFSDWFVSIKGNLINKNRVEEDELQKILIRLLK